jgi:hypothetical protein
MPLPPLFIATDPTAIRFQKPAIRQLRLTEPGTWWNGSRGDLRSACFPAVTTVVDGLLTLADPSTGVWRATVTPKTTQTGAAAADGMAPAYVEFTAAATALSDVVLGLIAAADSSATLTTAASVNAWKRFRSYVALTVSPVGATTLRSTSVAPGQDYTLEITAPAGNGSTITVIASPSTSTVKVGLYYAINRTLGDNGFNEYGQPYITEVTASTPAADFLGPVYLGADTEPVDVGFAFREYDEGSMVSTVLYGQPIAYGEGAVAAASVGTPVYVRHTTAGDYVAGLVTDQAGAALGATPNVWTGTPTVLDNTVYSMQITFGDVVETLTVLSDGTATDIEINDGLRAQLLGRPSLAELTGSGTTTLIITGPADGRGFTPAQSGAGVIAFVETTPEVSTHTLLTRGDRFLAPSTGVGSVPVDVPHA